MKNIHSVQCEGCGKIFRPEELTAGGTIGPHEWPKTSGGDPWDCDRFVSQSEQDCLEHKRQLDAEKQAYQARIEQARQRSAENVEKVLARCHQDDLLRRIVATGDAYTAKGRIDFLCTELGFDTDDLKPMGFEWEHWSEGFYQQCFDAAQENLPAYTHSDSADSPAVSFYVAVWTDGGIIESIEVGADPTVLIEHLVERLDDTFDPATDDARVFDATGQEVAVYVSPDERDDDDDFTWTH